MIWDIDTRALVRHIRKVGALRGIVATDGTPADQLIFEAKQLPHMAGQELASRVTCGKAYDWQKGSIELAISPWAEQMGESGAVPMRTNSTWSLTISASSRTFCACSSITTAKSRVVPRKHFRRRCSRPQARWSLSLQWPGRSRARHLRRSKIFASSPARVPIFGICLGHQLCGLALGGKTFKLKFGHHGSNHPVKNLLTNQVEITAQNHGFCVDPESLPSSDVEITHVNLNDHTNEGMRHKNLPLFSVQYHPKPRRALTIRTICSPSSPT